MTGKRGPLPSAPQAPTPLEERLRLVVQRARNIQIHAGGVSRGSLTHGLVVYAGFGWSAGAHDSKQATSLDGATLALATRKIFELRTFSSQTPPHLKDTTVPEETPSPLAAATSDRMHLAVRDAGPGAGVAVISQFTLWADCRHGNRPGFQRALPPARAHHLYDLLVDRCTHEAAREPQVPLITGVFGADMEISYVNDGPVTYVLDVAHAKVITL